MSVLIVGADHLGSIEKNLQHLGISEIEHISGRNVSDRRKLNIPKTTRCVVVLIDFINHNTAKNIKQTAKHQGVPLVFAKRSWSSMEQKLTEAGFAVQARTKAFAAAY